jgi:glycosyltransferase involved in cell wall biosynthesis
MRLIMNKFISIIVNCYNGQEFLDSCFQSILSQTYTNWEVIFFDNCSTDNSKSIFESFALNDNRFKYFKSDKTIPLYHARDEAIKLTNGDFIAFLDVDDIWINTKLSLQLPKFNNPSVGLVAGNFLYFNQREVDFNINDSKLIFETLPKGFVVKEMFQKYFVHMSSLMIRKEAYLNLEKGFDKRFTILGDFDLCIRLNIKWELDSVDVPTTYYRYHSNNTGKRLGLQYIDEMEMLIEEYKDFDEINTLSEFYYYSKRFYWLKFLKNLIENNKIEWLVVFFQVNTINKLKVIFCFFAPNSFIRSYLLKKNA